MQRVKIQFHHDLHCRLKLLFSTMELSKCRNGRIECRNYGMKEFTGKACRELQFWEFVGSTRIGLCLFRFVGFLFLLGSGKGCGLWLWHSLDFSLTFFIQKVIIGKWIRIGTQHFLQDCMCAQRRLKSACTFAQSDQSLRRALCG